MLFGTNTSFGLKVGTTTGNVPNVIVGYDRQEAVIMPLVANTRESPTAGANVMGPCDITTPVTATGGTGEFLIHPCLLVAVNGKAMDSYSVLASFGAQFEGTGTAGEAKAAGGLAQYFATGVAAQLLALNGGAAVVATGAAAAEAPKAGADRQTLEALYGKDTAFLTGVAAASAYGSFRSKLLAKIELTNVAVLQQRVDAFEKAAGTATRIQARCGKLDSCKKAITDNDAYIIDFDNDPAKLDQLLDAWKVES